MCIKGPVRAASKGLWTAGIGFTAGLGTWRSSRRPGERQGKNFDKKVGKMVDKKARTVWGATASVPHKTVEPLTCDSIHMELNEKKTTSIDLASFGRKMVFSRWHFLCHSSVRLQVYLTEAVTALQYAVLIPQTPYSLVGDTFSLKKLAL